MNMNLYEFRKIYRPKAITPFLGVLDELEYQFSYIHDSFKIVRDAIERNIYGNIREWNGHLNENHNPRVNIYIAITNIAYNHLQSGRYHLHFGVLAEFGEGKGLKELYDYSVKELVKLGHFSKKDAKEHHEALKQAISTIG